MQPIEHFIIALLPVLMGVLAVKRRLPSLQFIQIQAGNPVVHDGEERDMVRTNRRTMAD